MAPPRLDRAIRTMTGQQNRRKFFRLLGRLDGMKERFNHNARTLSLYLLCLGAYGYNQGIEEVAMFTCSGIDDGDPENVTLVQVLMDCLNDQEMANSVMGIAFDFYRVTLFFKSGSRMYFGDDPVLAPTGQYIDGAVIRFMATYLDETRKVKKDV